MEEGEPKRPHPDKAPTELQYPDGWREILEAPDTEDFRRWLADLTDLTQQKMRDANIAGAEDKVAIFAAWQRALEQVADITIDPVETRSMTEAQIVETTLHTLELIITSIGMGWEEEGLAFTVANLFTGEEATIYLLELM